MMGLSAWIVEETYSLSATFFTTLEKDTKMKEAKKKTVRALISPMISFFSKHHGLFYSTWKNLNEERLAIRQTEHWSMCVY